MSEEQFDKLQADLDAARAGDTAEDAEKDAKAAQLQKDLDSARADDATDDARIAALEKEVADLKAAQDGDTTDSKRTSLSSIQVFPDRSDFVGYQDYAKVFGVLGDLGIKRVRGNVGPATPDKAIQFYADALKNLGIKAWLTVGKPGVELTQAQWDTVETKIRKIGAGGVEQLNGWNEPNHIRGVGPAPASWVGECVTHQKALAALGAKLGIKVGTPSLWAGDLTTPIADATKLRQGGMTNAHFDHIAYHLYPGSGSTLAEFAARYDKHEAQLRTAYGDQTCPMVCTEYGWNVAPQAGASGAVRITDEERAKRLSILADRFVGKGIGHSLFELLQQPDSTGADREDWLGIVSTSWAKGATFNAYKTFLAGG